MSILDRVNITVARHKNDYFKNWTSQQLDDIDNITRPIEPVTPEIYSERIKINEVSRNKKLTHCINMATSENAPNWAKAFYKNCRRGLSTLQLKPKIKQPYCGGKIHPATTAKEPSNRLPETCWEVVSHSDWQTWKSCQSEKYFAGPKKKSPKIQSHA